MRLPKGPWLLGGVLVVAAVGGLLLLRRPRGAGPTAATGAPLAPPSASPTQLGLEFGGLQDQIGNLAAQISAGFAGPHNQQPAPTANSSPGAPCVDPRMGVGGGVGCGGAPTPWLPTPWQPAERVGPPQFHGA